VDQSFVLAVHLPGDEKGHGERSADEQADDYGRVPGKRCPAPLKWEKQHGDRAGEEDEA
jgi:hypothetical protein